MSEDKPLLGLLGTKLGMSQLLTAKTATPVTLIQAGPCPTIQVKTRERDGYDAIQVGFGEIAERKVTQARRGHFAKVSVKPLRHLREIRLEGPSGVAPGQVLTVDMFQPGEYVRITGVSKGQGFLGVMGRGHHGGPSSHGSMHHRRPGAIGSNTFRSNTLRGRILPGRVGSQTVTLPRVEVVDVDKDQHLLVVKGAVPGKPGTLLVIKQTGLKKVVRAVKPKVEKKSGVAKTGGRPKS